MVRREKDELQGSKDFGKGWSSEAYSKMYEISEELISVYMESGELKLNGWFKYHLRRYNDYGCNLDSTIMAANIVCYVIMKLKEEAVLREVLESSTKALMNSISLRLGLGELKTYKRVKRSELISQIIGKWQDQLGATETAESAETLKEEATMTPRPSRIKVSTEVAIATIQTMSEESDIRAVLRDCTMNQIREISEKLVGRIYCSDLVAPRKAELIEGCVALILCDKERQAFEMKTGEEKARYLMSRTRMPLRDWQTQDIDLVRRSGLCEQIEIAIRMGLRPDQLGGKQNVEVELTRMINRELYRMRRQSRGVAEASINWEAIERMIVSLKVEDIEDREKHMKSLTRSELEQIASEIGVSYRDGMTTAQLQRQIRTELDEQGYRDQLKKWHELVKEVQREEAEQRGSNPEDEELSEEQRECEELKVETQPYDYKLRKQKVTQLDEKIEGDGITYTEGNQPMEKRQRPTEYLKEHKGLTMQDGTPKETLEEVKYMEYEAKREQAVNRRKELTALKKAYEVLPQGCEAKEVILKMICEKRKEYQKARKESYEAYQGYKKRRAKEAA